MQHVERDAVEDCCRSLMSLEALISFFGGIVFRGLGDEHIIGLVTLSLFFLVLLMFFCLDSCCHLCLSLCFQWLTK